MKTITNSIILLFLISTVGFSQSKSFEILRDKFHGCENVFAFNTSGFIARTILWVGGEHDFTKALKEVRSVRTIIIPKTAFSAKGVSLNGFMKVAKDDNFEEIMKIKDHGDDVTLMIQSDGTKDDNRYLLLVDDDDEVVAMELVGYINPQFVLTTYDRSYN